MPYNKYVAGRKRISGPKCASGKNSAQCWRCAFVLSPQAVDLPEKNACAYDESMTGQTIYAYVEGDPLSFVDPFGLEKLNFLPPGDPNNTAANWNWNPSGSILINSHGSPSTVNHMNARQLAKKIKKEAETWKPGTKITLNACNTGKGDNSIAQQLSKILHTTVVAPDQPTWTAGPVDLGAWGKTESGGMDITQPGHWNTFVNGVKQ